MSILRVMISRTYLRDYLVWELHAGGLVGHFGRKKTVDAVKRLFYWPRLKSDIAKLTGRCHTC